MSRTKKGNTLVRERERYGVCMHERSSECSREKQQVDLHFFFFFLINARRKNTSTSGYHN